VIRPYAEPDLDALIDVWDAASKVATPFLPAAFMAGEPENIKNIYIPNAETWVIDADDTVAGFLSLIGDEVGAIFVHPRFQGRGYGRALMDHAVSLRDALFLDVFKENALGRRFYDSYGFRFEREYVHEKTGHVLLRLVYEPR
jgi:putative acetyltransferase